MKGMWAIWSIYETDRKFEGQDPSNKKLLRDSHRPPSGIAPPRAKRIPACFPALSAPTQSWAHAGYQRSPPLVVKNPGGPPPKASPQPLPAVQQEQPKKAPPEPPQLPSRPPEPRPRAPKPK